jgi:cytochrome bd-type quinol oxidase subunit 1
MDALLLSRAQMAPTLSFHILFPTLTIGLAVFLAILESPWLKTDDESWSSRLSQAGRLWTREGSAARGWNMCPTTRCDSFT